MDKQQWVLVTQNKGKVKEFNLLFKESGIEFITLDEIGFKKEIEETGTTFAENALIKVEAVRPFTDLPLLSDDSGLAVEALNGEPGVYSARYAGENATNKENRTKLLNSLKGIENRKAYFECTLCFLKKESLPLDFTGKCQGSIALSESGQGGFGYDPLFIPDNHQETFGTLPSQVKASLSHRAKASNLLKHHLL